jgi:hypothetical protein
MAGITRLGMASLMSLPINKGGLMPQLPLQYTDWRDFTNRVCRPWIDNDGLDDVAEAQYAALFAAMPDYYLAAAFVLADNALRRLESPKK